MKSYQVKVSIDDELRVWLLARAEESGSSLSQAAREILHRTMKAEAPAPAPALPRKFGGREFLDLLAAVSRWDLDAAGDYCSPPVDRTVALNIDCYAELLTDLAASSPELEEITRDLLGMSDPSPVTLAGYVVQVSWDLAPNTARVGGVLVMLPK